MTKNDANGVTFTSPWPHRWAVALVSATFPLIWVGGLVTTYQAGMAVPDWPTTYGYNLFLYPWQTWLLGPWDLFIEHGHRLLGAAVGLISIGLLVVLWRYDSRVWMRYLGLLVVAAVCVQGALGGLRVLFDERTLAKIHGCFGPAFFALSVALAVLTSRLWTNEKPAAFDPQAGKLRRLAAFTACFAYLQLVLGAQLRHVALNHPPAAFRGEVLFHLLVAGVLTIHAVWLAVTTLRWFRRDAALVRPALGLTVVTCVQLLLGAGTWVVNYGWPIWLADRSWSAGFVVVQEGLLQAFVTTAHVAAGSLILVTSVMLALRSFRLYRGEPWRPTVRSLVMEVAV